MNEQLAGLRPVHRDALRLVGVTLFATGALALFLRKSEADQWAAFPKLLVLAIPCVLLYGLGIGALRLGRPDDDATTADAHTLAAWRSTAAVFGLILMPLTLLQLVDTIGGDPSADGHITWVFAATAAAGFFASLARGLRWGALFGGLALILAWLAFWNAIVDPSATATRWLFLLVGAGLAAGAWRLHRDREGPELATAAGIALLVAGILGLVGIADSATGGAISTFGGDDSIKQHQEWDVFLLLVAIGLIWYGAHAPWRGPVYVGGLTLFAFILSVAFEVTALFSGDGPSGDVMGWPLLLLVLGAAALLAGLLGGGDRTAATPADTAPTEAMPPPAAPPEAPPPQP
jgi:hypothetical protein